MRDSETPFGKQFARVAAVFAVAWILLVICMMAIGCGLTADTQAETTRFELDSDPRGRGLTVITDTETGVQYLIANGAVTPLYNADGSLHIAGSTTQSASS